MYYALDVSVLLVLALAIPAGGFLLRTYIVFHDCAHGSFLPTKRGNALAGRVLGLIVYTPFQSWRHSHAVHHATAGDLDRRGSRRRAHAHRRRVPRRRGRSALATACSATRWSCSASGRLGADLQPRLVSRSARPRIKRSVIAHQRGARAVVVRRLCWLIGWQAYLLVQRSRVMLAGAAGRLAVLRPAPVRGHLLAERRASGATPTPRCAAARYLRLPKVLQFFTGNIGLHHVHHLSARVPNYNLQRAHDAQRDLPLRADAHALGRPARRAAQALGRGARSARDVRRGALAARRRWPTATTSTSPTR